MSKTKPVGSAKNCAENLPRRACSGAAAVATKQESRPLTRRNSPRGAAPWAARHAVKRAAEAAERNASPPAPGSARATLRTPEDAEKLKARITELASHIARLNQLRRSLPKDFWEVSCMLVSIVERRLFEAKGYCSFEAFAERELELGKSTAQRLVRLSQVFQPSAAPAIGYVALMRALEALEQEPEGPTRVKVPVPAKPLKPPFLVRG